MKTIIENIIEEITKTSSIDTIYALRTIVALSTDISNDEYRKVLDISDKRLEKLFDNMIE